MVPALQPAALAGPARVELLQAPGRAGPWGGEAAAAADGGGPLPPTW